MDRRFLFCNRRSALGSLSPRSTRILEMQRFFSMAV